MKISPHIAIDKYIYDLPDEKIAYKPVTHRDQSRLLVYKDGEIDDYKFSNLVKKLPQESLLVFNNTRVVQARLIFYKETGARIEIFCLEPVDQNIDIHDSYSSKSPVMWKCLIGNAKKWKGSTLEKTNEEGNTIIKAEKIDSLQDSFLVKFSWYPETLSFAEILEHFGRIPLPPYIHREDDNEDRVRYQTLYNEMSGSVAAPTAGLHFSEELLEQIDSGNIPRLQVTLHVGAGTFKPVTTNYVDEHKMHHEQFSVSYQTVENLIQEDNRQFVIVGTTTVRTLESLFWFGARLLQNGKNEQCPVEVKQWEPYQYDFDKLPSRKEVLKAIQQWMYQNNVENITGITSLMIVPGYRYQMTDVLITNFHSPASTLLLLVAAFVGDDWQKIYDYALNNDFRFLSYGDSCLLFKNV